MSKLLQDVVAELGKLPGVGRRTAMRLALHILKAGGDNATSLTQSIDHFMQGVRYCSICNNLCDDQECHICMNRQRDRSTICVVEDISDLLSIESTDQFGGLYHVLGGVISPMQGIAPSDLTIDKLVERAKLEATKEIILALPTSIEGETTHFYIMNRLRDIPTVKVTAIARGIGFGDELEYVDHLTLTHALNNRRKAE